MAESSLNLAELIDEIQNVREQLRLQEEQILTLQQELDASRDRYSELYEFAPVAMVSLNRSGIIVSANTTAMHMLEWEPRMLIGRPMALVVVPDHRLRFMKFMRDLRISKSPFAEVELSLHSRSGRDLQVQLVARQLLTEGLNSPLFPTVINELGAEQRLREQLRSLASRLSVTEEQERRRIAVEIHDRISQKLALCKMQLSGVKNAIAPGSEGVVQGVLDLLAELLDDTRRLTFELSPPILYELGFVAAIEWLAEQYQQAHKIEITVEGGNPVDNLPDDLRVLLFQCTRELLNNVVKHSHAKHVRIALRQTQTQVSLTIRDDGVGFDVAEAQVLTTNRTTFGLFSIRQRIEEVGGSFSVRSSPRSGSTATIAVALDPATQAQTAARQEQKPPARVPSSNGRASQEGSARSGKRRKASRRRGAGGD
jgi:PAS domain S-box-containing protein